MNNKIKCEQCNKYFTPDELNINFEYKDLIRCPSCGNKSFEESKTIEALWDSQFEGVCYGHKTD